MAEIAERWEDNVPGPYFIDKTCTSCNVCMEEAPNNIKESDDGDHCIVFKQPENDDELAEMQNAIDGCPTESLGKAE